MEHTVKDAERRSSDVVTMDNICDAYARRSREKHWKNKYPDIVGCNLLYFAKEYGFFPEKNLLQKLKTKVFVSFYPRGSSNYKKSEGGFRKYCKYQIMKFCPWDVAQ